MPVKLPTFSKIVTEIVIKDFQAIDPDYELDKHHRIRHKKNPSFEALVYARSSKLKATFAIEVSSSGHRAWLTKEYDLTDPGSTRKAADEAHNWISDYVKQTANEKTNAPNNS